MGGTTIKEQMLAELLGDVGKLHDTIKDLPDALKTALDSSVGHAGAKYASDLQQLTQDTKVALTEFIERRASATTAMALDEHRKAMQEAAALAFEQSLAPAMEKMVELSSRQVVQDRSMWLTRCLLAFALGAGCSTAIILAVLRPW